MGFTFWPLPRCLAPLFHDRALLGVWNIVAVSAESRSCCLDAGLPDFTPLGRRDLSSASHYVHHVLPNTLVTLSLMRGHDMVPSRYVELYVIGR